MIRLSATYFALVFAAGFVLGAFRVTLLVSSLGRRNAELLEIPVMLVVIFIVGRWIARRSASRQQAFGIGFLALAMLLAAEVGLAAALFNKSPIEALFNKDPISGSAYYISLLLFAVMPGWVRGNTLQGNQPS